MTISSRLAALFGVGGPISRFPALWFGDVAPQNEGRSGYWRLFFTQLQEQALKDKEEPVPEKPFEEPYKIVSQKDGGVVVQFPDKKVKKSVVMEPAEEQTEVIPLKRPPVAPVVRNDGVLPTVFDVQYAIGTLVADYKLLLRRTSQELDDEDDAEILLLVA